jgi:signal transduction histidine kinase
VSLSRTVIRSGSGEPVGETVIIRDETRQRALERQMLRSERLAAAGRLAAGIVHEINNPIGVIVNRIDCLDLELEESGPGYPGRSDLAVIRRQAERVGAVARRLLTLAREESETRQALDLNELVSGVIAFVGPELRKRSLRWDADLAVDLPAIVANPHGIETVLLNLLLNALDATPEGGAISVTTRADENGIEFEVTDTGSGMSPEVLEHVFEPFFTTKVKPRGTGLGLAVCHSVVQAHGGEIRMWSEPERGSRFTVWLPVGGEEGTA